MTFQFSIARLLMATAMIAIIFGMARMMLDEELSTYAIYIAALAVVWGLIVLVARKRSDVYRILRVVVCAIWFPTILASLGLLADPHFLSRLWGCVLLATGVAVIWLVIFINSLIAKAEEEEDNRNELPNGSREN